MGKNEQAVFQKCGNQAHGNTFVGIEDFHMEKLGFYFLDEDTVEFFASKRLKINYGWTLYLKEVKGIASCRRMRGDDDSSFLVFFRGENVPIYLNITYDTEEMHHFRRFKQKLSDRFFIPLVNNCPWDTTGLMYPEGYDAEDIYLPWHHPWETFLQGLRRMFELEHCASGVLKPRFKVLLQSGPADRLFIKSKNLGIGDGGSAAEKI